MPAAQLPPNETARLDALHDLRVLDTPAEASFDRLTGMAKRIFDVPIAVVSLVDEDRQWFKSCIGLDVTETPRKMAFCAHTILGRDVLVVPDARDDVRFADNPVVTGDPHIRFYAGAPLITSSGLAVGTLCVIDTQPRPGLTLDQTQHLAQLARIVVDELELRQALGGQIELTETAEHANQVKTEFLAWLSHEVRSPTSAVLGFAQLLATSDLTQDQHDWVQYIIQGGSQIVALAEDILDFSRVEAGSLQLQKQRVDVCEVVEREVGLQFPNAVDHNVTLTAVVDASVPAVVTDAKRLGQVVVNLLTNAIKYNREGGSVRVALSHGQDGHVRLEVADTGHGIAREHLSQIFEPFERVGDTRRVAGAGVGLALCRTLVERMGGRIGVESEVGTGSRFWVDLPVGSLTDTGPKFMIDTVSMPERAPSSANPDVTQPTHRR